VPRQLSFKHTVQVWVAWSQRQFLSTVAQDTAALFRLIAHIRVGNRPGRMEPRLIKTRPKRFGRLQTTRRTALRVLTIFDGLIFTLFEVRFPFRFPRAVGENGKRNWELDSRGGVLGQSADSREVRFG
jgi:hypothetical protein